MTDGNATALHEISERIKTLRDKAERARASAEIDEAQAAESREAAARQDQVADQYEAVLRFAESHMSQRD